MRVSEMSGKYKSLITLLLLTKIEQSLKSVQTKISMQYRVFGILIERKFIMSNKFDNFLQEQLQDPEIRKEYEALQPEHTVIQTMIDVEQKSGMPCKELDSLERIS